MGYGIGRLHVCLIWGTLTIGMAVFMYIIKYFNPAPHHMVSNTQLKDCPSHDTRILERSL